MSRPAKVTGRVFAFRLPPDDQALFEAACEKRGVSYSVLARELVLRGLKDAL